MVSSIVRALLLLAVVVTVARTFVISDVDPQSYLKKFGYLNNDAATEISDIDMEEAILRFQDMASVEKTGKVDEATLEMMRMPRCGFHDLKVSMTSGGGMASLKNIVKRYVLYGTRWNHKSITYAISKYPEDFPSKDVDDAAAAAFKLWENVIPLDFQQIVDKADIDIRFEKGDHGDDSPFDGPGGILGHSYKPRRGVAHFDADESWGVGYYGNGNKDLKQVMTHEFGHVLGLDHSHSRGAIMAPFYRQYDPNLALKEDDIIGIQAIYGVGSPNPNPKPRITTTSTKRPPTTTPTTTTERPSPTDGDVCENPVFDAFAFSLRGGLIGFRGSKYYHLSYTVGVPKAFSIKKGYGVDITHIDAAIKIGSKTLMFKEDRVYASEKGRAVAGYPKALSDTYPGVPNSVTAIFTYKNDLYFVKYNTYYKTAITEMTKRAKQVPCPFKYNSYGGPHHIEAAFEYPNFAVNLFIGKAYYSMLVGADTLSEKTMTNSYWMRCTQPTTDAPKNATTIAY